MFIAAINRISGNFVLFVFTLKLTFLTISSLIIASKIIITNFEWRIGAIYKLLTLDGAIFGVALSKLSRDSISVAL